MTSLADGFVAHLGDPSMDIRSKLNVATELRDSVEINHVTVDQNRFMSQLLPEITRLLDSVPISMVSTSPEHKLRHCLLDILARLQPNETLRPEAKKIMDLVVNTIKTDNEENGVVCMKILTNLHRAFKADLADYVQPFLDLVVTIIGNMPKVVHDLFDSPTVEEDNAHSPATSTGGNNGATGSSSGNGSAVTPSASTPSSLPSNTRQQHPILFPAMQSFRVLTECPIIVVLLFTSHRQQTAQTLPVLVPHAIEILTLEAVAQAKEHAAAASRGTFFAGVAPSLSQGAIHQSYNDFVTAQVKVMSFVAFIVRAFSPAIQPHLPIIPNFIIRLLKDCPTENSSARKELIVSMRHILSTEHRNFFLNKVQTLLEDRVLIGSGLTAYENLRPLAYSTVADLIHHIRNELITEQIWQAVRVFTRSLLDMKVAAHFQAMSLKLLLNILDRLTSMQKPDEGRQILMLVLKFLVDRLTILNRQNLDSEKALRRNQSIIKIVNEVPHGDIKDAKFVYRSLIFFMRSLMFGLKSSNPQPKYPLNFTQWQECARVFNCDDVQLFRQLLRESLVGLRIYIGSKDITVAKELMDALVGVFMQLDPATFNEVFEQEIQYVVDWVLMNSEHTHFTYLLSGNEATSTGFSTILLAYLMSKIDEVGEEPNGEILLKLFKQCFSAINLFPAVNESVVLPHLKDLIIKTLELSNNASEPKRYIALLQHLFRTLGGGRFDSVYKLVLPLLYYLLETLNKRLSVARLPEEKNIYADLCLTVPVRLSLMVPHLSFLMKPLAHALSAVDTNTELVVQGLRTLELCVDNLTASYFDPHIEPVLPEILPSLWKLLKPLPFDHKLSHTTLRILGKLGGRSRAHIMPPSDLQSIDSLNQDISATLSFENDVDVSVRITPGVKVAMKILEMPSEYGSEFRVKAFKFISVVLFKFFPYETKDLDSQIVHNIVGGKYQVAENAVHTKELPEVKLDKEQRIFTTGLLEQLLSGLFLACMSEELREESTALIADICEHLVFLELGEVNLERRRVLRPFLVDEYEGFLNVSPRAFASAIVFALSHQNEEVNKAGLTSIKQVAEIGKVLSADKTEVHRYPMFRALFAKLSHSCFEEPWYIKQGAVKGLEVIIKEIRLPPPWLVARIVEMARTLMFVVKETSPVGGYGSCNVPSIISTRAADLFMFILDNTDFTTVPERTLTMLTGLLAFELESPCRFGRGVAQRALKRVAAGTNTELSTLLEKVSDIFLTPIFMKPLRALPFPMQIGYSDCVSFCISQPKPFLRFNDKLLRLLEEALALVDADDESLTSSHRIFEYTTAQQLTELRVMCIRLLALATTSSEELGTNHPVLRGKIIAVFFKTMSSDPQPAVDAAYEGLKMVLQVSQKLPKELLQAGLRPILLPLSDFKRLNVNVLDCLTRLLELLTYNFKVEIGTKLLDHLRTFSEPSRLLSLSNRVLSDDDRVKIGVAVINVFHMLPPTAHIFIPDLMSVLVNIEDVLRRSQDSPFRDPTAKLLNRYPAESFTYFSEKLTDMVYGSMFCDFLKRAPKLAEHTKENVEELCSRIMTQASETDQCFGICTLIKVANIVNVPRKVILNLVSSVGDVTRATFTQVHTSPLHVSVPMAINQLQLLVLRHLREGENGADVWDSNFDLIETLVVSLFQAQVSLVPELNDYLWEQAINTENTKAKQFWIMKALSAATNPSICTTAKEFFMNVLNTILMVHAEQNGNSLDDLLTPEWLQRVNEDVWQSADTLIPPEGSQYNPVGSGLGTSTLNFYIIQMLKMSVLLVRFAPSKIADMRKNVIKFGWRYISVEDAVSKLCAYVLVCYFTAAFDTLPKIVAQIYMALLKVSQPEVRSLVQQALDTLATVLVQRINSPMWYRAPRRVLSEDGHGIISVSNVCLFLARHSSLFFPHREMYVPFIVSALARLSYMANQNLDVDLAELMAAWEKERYSVADSGKDENAMAIDDEPELNNEANSNKDEKKDVSPKKKATDDSVASTSNVYEVPHAIREATVTYLVRFITAQPMRPRDPRSAQRIMSALDVLLGVWPDTEVRLNFFDRTLVQPDFASSPQSLNASLDALRMIDLALKHKSDEQIAGQLDEISQLLTKPLLSTMPQVHSVLLPIVERVLECDHEESFLRHIVGVIGEHLSPPPGSSSRTVWVHLAEVVIRVKPSCLDEHMSQAIKVSSKMAKERLEIASGASAPSTGSNSANITKVANPTQQSVGDQTTNNASAPADPSGPNLLVPALELVASRISYLGDQRRSFLSLIAHVIERINDKTVSNCILAMVRSWVFGSEPFPTMKEKSAILHKLLVFSDPDLVEKYYDIIIDIFEDQRLRSTELPNRLEQPFLVGCTQPNQRIRTRLLQILNGSIDNVVSKRLVYVLNEQNWEPLADKQWLCQALQIILDPLKPNQNLLIDNSLGFASVGVFQYLQQVLDNQDESMDVDTENSSVTELISRRVDFLSRIRNTQASDFVESLSVLMFVDADLVHETWKDVFPAIYHGGFSEKEKHEVVKGLVMLMAKEYHIKQADARPNVIQTLLSGVASANEQVPPQLLTYLATNYCTWYTGIQICESIHEDPLTNSLKVADVNLDILAELHAALGDDDHFYGLWRTRSKFPITAAALSYEQCGMWNKAMQLHETAQVRARSGVLPFGESEYGLWEDHWIYCAEKLQHWEILTDIAKHEGFTDLLLECQWRLADWMTERDTLAGTIKTVMDVPTPRRQVFETFLSLQGFAQKSDSLQNLSHTCDEGIQLSLRKWHALPRRFTQAHAPLLHTFQQFVEFMEATQVYTSLQATTVLNLEAKSQELKGVMQAWHDRLPNVWEDINWWGDLAAWRQHVFGVINRVYLPLIPQLQAQQGPNNGGQNSSSSAAYRGYHEIAWTINRFAHTARKQNLPDVCVTQLSKIYTLPNIEIQEAFLKLREQAKCHLQNPNELATGLDVISNTNLAFFGNPQKAEFFALKGESLAKLGQYHHAYNVLSAAVQVDLHLPKAWAAWGEFSDHHFAKNPTDVESGSSAITCYLHAITQYKNRKSRKLIGRLLWLLGLDDPTGQLGSAFEEYKGETPTWYWVTYIPQLLTSLSQKEAKYTSRILIKIAKAFPQALHFHLRTAREEYALMQRVKQRYESQEHSKGASNESGASKTSDASKFRDGAKNLSENTRESENADAKGSDKSNENTEGSLGENDHNQRTNVDDIRRSAAGSPNKALSPNSSLQSDVSSKGHGLSGSTTNSPATNPASLPKPSADATKSTGADSNSVAMAKSKEPWEYSEDIMRVLKTAYPLLALSLETLIDQMNHRFKSLQDEDAYRLIVALLNDGLSVLSRQSNPREDQKIPPTTEANVSKFADGVIPEQLKGRFEADFVNPSPTIRVYIARLRKWRNRLEARLDSRPSRINLEALSPPLSEFHYQKLEDVEVPGQNMELVDDNRFFTKISRLDPQVDLVRSHGICYRRITIHATDGSTHPFSIQYPASRTCRREERVSQIYKILNSVMQRRTEARRRNITFTLPNAIPLNMHVRLVQDDPKYVSFYQIYEKFCRERGQSRDAPFDYTFEHLRAAVDPQLPKPDMLSIKLEILAGIQAKLVPQTILRDFFISQYRSYEDFWLFRKQFAYQYAALSFMTIMMSINSRYPHKFLVNMRNGNVWGTEMLPIVSQIKQPPTYLSGEPVAFRMTPNIQKLMGPHVTEGIFAPAMMIIAKGLCDPEFDLQHFLPLFVRDEIISWFANQLNPLQRRPVGISDDQTLQTVIKTHVDIIARRAASLGQPGPSNSAANQTALDLISMAVLPRNLALSDILWMPYY